MLSPGFSKMSLDQLHEVCVEPFSEERRQLLFENLCLFLNNLSKLGLVGKVWVDGSFLTEKPEPGDVDILIVLDSDACANLGESQVAAINAEFSGAKTRYSCDAYTISDTNSESDIRMRAYWRGLFGYYRDESTPKGIALLELSP